MATARQKAAARRNLTKARQAQRSKAHSGSQRSQGAGLSTAEKNDLPDSAFAFPKARKEPLTDARQVRNALARFAQVEGVSDREREQAWRRILRAADKFDVEVDADSWKGRGDKARPR